MLITHQTIESREKALRRVSRFPFHSSSRLTMRLDVRQSTRRSATRCGRSRKTTVSACSSTDIPILP
jgi:hypothetical protein